MSANRGVDQGCFAKAYTSGGSSHCQAGARKRAPARREPDRDPARAGKTRSHKLSVVPGVDIHRAYGMFARWARPARMETFLRRLDVERDTTILDIGGTTAFWADVDLNVTLLNTREPDGVPANLGFTRGSATKIPYPDSSFEIAFSNSTIEHLHTRENQRMAAREAMRVGQRLWIQTPNRWFPIEPHYLTPFIHWLPRTLQKRLVRNCTAWGLITRPSKEYVESIVDEIRLLSASELRELFPDCCIVRERVFGLTKSLIVVR